MNTTDTAIHERSFSGISEHEKCELFHCRTTGHEWIPAYPFSPDIQCLVILFLMWIACGCHKEHSHDATFYLRYPVPDAPPLEEFYVASSEGMVLTSLCYDSDGDWFLDTHIEFHSVLLCNWVSVQKLPTEALVDRVWPRKKMQRILCERIGRENAMVFFIEPRDLSPSNTARFASREYQQALECTELHVQTNAEMPVGSEHTPATDSGANEDKL